MKVHLVKMFDLHPLDRSLLTFSDTAKIRNPEEDSQGSITLKLQASKLYPTTADLHVKGSLFAPEAVRQWKAIDVELDTPLSATKAAVTSIQWRLNDGTDDRYHNGTSWVAAGASSWNTLAQLQANFSTFPTATHKIRWVANLRTTDGKLTPKLKAVWILWEADIASFAATTIYDGLVRQLKALVKPVTDLTLSWPGGLTTDLDNLGQEEPLTVADVEGAFALASDPKLQVNLKSAYNTGTKVLTLTSDPGVGANVLLRVVYTPTVVVTTHPDFNGAVRVPALEIVDISSTMESEPASWIKLINRADGSGFKIRAPRQLSYACSLRACAARAKEALGLAEATLRALRQTPRLTLQTLDTTLEVVIESDPAMAPRLDKTHLHDVAFGIRLVNVEEWLHLAESIVGVRQIKVTGDMTLTFP